MSDLPVIAMIGTGNMGSSLIGGLIKDGHPADKIWAADPSKEKIDFLHTTYGIHTTTDNVEAIAAAKAIVFAIKPQLFAQVATPLAPAIKQHQCLVISIAAGIRETNISQWIGTNIPIVRTMPNTPALIGCGATALFANKHVTPQQRDIAESIMRAVGITIWLANEDLMDTVTALSGSGPAYFFLMMESLVNAAEQLGLSKETAHLLTLQTALGASRMAIESGQSLSDLRKQVTSPGGTTEKAIQVLEENQIKEIYQQALAAAKERSQELAKILVSD